MAQEVTATNEVRRYDLPDERMHLEQRDIVTASCKCIVNTANQKLTSGGAGVNDAIHRAAGPRLAEECATLGGCRIGEAKITAGYDLPAQWVIHTVAPSYDEPNAVENLEGCYRNALRICKRRGIRTLAFPLISAGRNGFPVDEAAQAALLTVRAWLNAHRHSTVLDVTFCCPDPAVFDVVKGYMEKL